MERSKQLELKKIEKIKKKRLDLTREIDSSCYAIPNNKQIENARKPEDYYQDQVKFIEQKKERIEGLKKKSEEIEVKELKTKPSINKVF